MERRSFYLVLFMNPQCIDVKKKKNISIHRLKKVCLVKNVGIEYENVL